MELFERKLKAADLALGVNLQNHSMAALGDEPSMPGVGFTHAFGLWDRSEIYRHREIIEDGLKLFERGFRIFFVYLHAAGAATASGTLHVCGVARSRGHRQTVALRAALAQGQCKYGRSTC